MKSWILLLMAAALVAVSCTTGETAPEPDVGETTSTVPVTSTPEMTSTTEPEEIITTTARATTTTTDALPDGVREFAYVVGVEVADDGTVVVTADYAQFLTGDEATQAAIEDGYIVEGETVPNDYYIVNENPRLRELALEPSAQIVLNACFVDGECVTQVRVTIDQWVALLDGDSPDGLGDGFQWYGQATLPYWLIFDGESIVGVEEQYLP